MADSFYKTAGMLDAARRFGSSLRAGIPKAGTFVRQQVVGEPLTFAQQFKDNTLFQKGGLYNQAIVPRGKVQTALMYGLPAISVAQAAQMPDEMKGSATGATIGSTIGAIAGTPLGAVGQMAGSSALGSLGESVGSLFDRKPGDHRLT